MSKGCVLVTGAEGGMGRAACEALAREGWDVIGLDVKPGEPRPWRVLAVDLTDEGAVNSAAETLRGEGVTLAGVVHLAGIYDLNSLVEIPEEEMERIFQINVLGAYRVNKVFLPLFSPETRILITTSELAPLHPLPFTGLYGVTKAALDRYADALRMELQLLGHTVITLRPGAVRTGLLTVSTDRLDAFCANTRLYACNAERFRAIVNAVEARAVPPEKVAGKVVKILSARHLRLTYSLNRNPLLLLMNLLPKRLQLAAIRWVLKA